MIMPWLTKWGVELELRELLAVKILSVKPLPINFTFNSEIGNIVNGFLMVPRLTKSYHVMFVSS